MHSSPMDSLHPSISKNRFVNEVRELEQIGVTIVLDADYTAGARFVARMPSGRTATLILDHKWPFASPTIEDESGERFRMWDPTPMLRLHDLIPTWFTKRHQWIRMSVCFEP